MDFEINQWLDEKERFLNLSKQISPSLALLKQANCLEKVLYYWIRHEIISSHREDNPSLVDNSDQSIILDWSTHHFKHRLNELFLERKDLLDIVSFYMLRVENHSIAFEMYHRLLSKESSFNQVSSIYSINADKNKDAFQKNVRMGSLPEPLQNVLRTLKVGQISKPLSVNKVFTIIMLDNYQKAELNESMKEKLLLDQFSSWANSVARASRDRLS